MTPATHLLSGYLVGKWIAPRERRWTIGAALFGSIVSDFDVLLGLVGGWAGAGAHRGATHSFLGGLIIATLAAAPFRRRFRVVFVACLAGLLTHILWDWLNFWGVRALWPWVEPYRGNLLHEQDRFIVLILALASVFLWRDWRRASLVCLAALAPYLALHFWWRERSEGLARVELAGRPAGVYPGHRLSCGWIVLSAAEHELSVHCVTSPWAKRLEPARTFNSADDLFVRASQQSAAVRDFRQKVPFSFAQVRPEPDGGALVVWRDLRVAHQESPEAEPTGIYVWVDNAGRVLQERHRWWLKLW